MTGGPPGAGPEEALQHSLVEREMAARGRRHRWWLGWRVGAVAAIVLVLVLLGCGWSGMDCCATCGSYRDVAGIEFGLGAGEPWFRIRWKNEVRPSRALADLFPPGHVHNWRQSYLSSLRRGKICGGLYGNSFCMAYDRSEELRRLVQGKIASRETTREEVARVIGIQRLHGVGRRATVPAGTYELVRKANAWIQEADPGGLPLWTPRDSPSPWPPEEAK